MILVSGAQAADRRGTIGICGAADFSSPSHKAWTSYASQPGIFSLDASTYFYVLGDDASSPFPRVEIAADAQLHNRRDLSSSLGLPARPLLSDAGLIAAAYEKWGADCATRLEGEFAFVLRDRRKNCLFCCRDQMGSRPLFYWRKGSRFAFATDPRLILRLPGVERQLNRQKLAAMGIGGNHHHLADETFHYGILSLPPANWMQVDAAGMRQSVYWTPEISETLVPRRPEKAFEAFRALLFDAVSCRVEGKRAAVMLSGGLDSSAVTSIAARVLQCGNRELPAMSSVLPEELRSQFTDEKEFIDEFRSWPNLRIEYVTAPGRGPFDAIDDHNAFEVTPLRTSRYYLYEAFDALAASMGAEVILGGEWGEFSSSHSGVGYPAELAARFRWITLLREMIHMSSVRNLSVARIASRIAVESFEHASSAPLVILAEDFEHSFPALPEFRNPGVKHWKDHRLIHRDLLQRWLRKHSSLATQSLGRHTRFSYPLLDKRLVEFCLAAPGHLKIRDGYRRYMVRGALGGVLPEKIRWRTSKQPFSPDYLVRYNSQLPRVREFMAAIRTNDPVRAVVDVNRLSKLLGSVDPLKPNPNALGLVPSTIYLICFLRQFAEFHT